MSNQGSQDEFHDLMVNGFSISDGINFYKDQALTQLIPSGHYIPAHATISSKCVAYTTGGVFADLTNPQDGKSFLDCGTKLRQRQIPELIQADTENVFFDTDGNPIDKDYTSLTYGILHDKYFTGNKWSDDGYLTNITNHAKALKRHQLDVEPIVRDAVQKDLPVDDRIPITITVNSITRESATSVRYDLTASVPTPLTETFKLDMQLTNVNGLGHDWNPYFSMNAGQTTAVSINTFNECSPNTFDVNFIQHPDFPPKDGYKFANSPFTRTVEPL